MAYLFLALAILCEVIGAIASTYAEGFKKTIPSMIVTLAIIASYYFFAVSLQYGMNIGIGYAIWAGVGVLSVAFIGAMFLKDSLTIWQMGGVLLVIGGLTAVQLGGKQIKS